MGKHLKTAVKLRILELLSLGATKIFLKLAEEGEVVGRGAIYGVLKKWDTHKTIGDLPPPPRPRLDVTNEVLDFIDLEMERDDELSARNLQKNVNSKFNVNFSISKVALLRRKLGWLAEKTRYCQLV